MVEAGAGAGVVVQMVAVVEAVPSTSTVRRAKRTSSPFFIFFAHSHTSDSDKKIHQGWGGDDGNTEFKTEQAATVDAAVESGTNEWGVDPAATTTADDWGAPTVDASAADPWAAPVTTTDAWDTPSSDPTAVPAGDNDKPEGRPRRERDVEEEDNTLTLSQYLAQQKEKDSVIPKLENTRKANEGAGDDIWKGQVALTKNEEEDAYFVGKVGFFSLFAISIY